MSGVALSLVLLLLAIFPQLLNKMSRLIGVYSPVNALFAVLLCCGLVLMISFSEFYSMIEQPLILLDPADHIMPLSVEMNHISRLFPNTVFAASVLFILPCLLLYLLVRKQMIRKMNELTLI